MPNLSLDHVRNWIFDLDNTLYHPDCRLFDHIDRRMGEFIICLLGVDAIEARRIQKLYFHDHGTTLAGLMRHHDVDPDEFLDFVHDIPLDGLEPTQGLRDAIERLPGRKIIFTNADSAYATRVLEKRGLGGVFDPIVDIRACNYAPKPEMLAYRSLLDICSIDAEQCLFVEDMARNLAPAKALGMTTIWVNNGSESGSRGIDRVAIDHEIEDIAGWISTVVQSFKPQEKGAR